MISRIKSPFRLLAALFVFAAWMTGNAGEPDSVKYVFLFIGDGLSMPQRMVTQEYLSRVEPGRDLLINTLEKQAVTTTRAADQFITDSAASGTAIACGSKTLVGRLGVDAEGNALESVAEVAKKNGLKVLGGFAAKFASGRFFAILTGPVGWAATAAWTLFDVAGPAVRVMIPATIAVAYLRIISQKRFSS